MRSEHDLHGRMVKFQGNTLALTAPIEQAMGRSVFDLPPAGIPVMQAMERIQHGSPLVRFRHRLQTADGQGVLHEGIARREGRICAMTCRDITYHYRPPVRRALLQAVTLAISHVGEDTSACVVDAAGLIWWWSRAAERTTGLHAGVTLGRTLAAARYRRDVVAASIPTRERCMTIALISTPVVSAWSRVWLVTRHQLSVPVTASITPVPLREPIADDVSSPP